MALVDPNIAMSYRGVEIPNQLAQYGQLAQIQNAQNQNQLAQYQLSSAQRADEQQNNLYAAARQPGFTLDFQSALKYGAPGMAAFKAQQEATNAKLTQTKTQGEIDAQEIAAAQKRVDAFSTALAPLVSAVQSKKPITHDDVFRQATRLVAQGLLKKEDLASIPMKAEQLPSFVMSMASSTENSRKALETYLPKALVAGGSVINQNPLAAGGIGNKLADVTMTPFEAGRLPILQGQLDVARQNANTNADRFSAETTADTMTPQTLDLAANTYLQTGQLPTGLGKASSQLRTQVMNRATELASGKPAAELAGDIIDSKITVASRTKAVKDFSTGMQGRQVNAFNTAIDHLHTMDKLSDALMNGDVKAFNSLGNTIARQTGAPAPANFDAAKQIVTAEIIKAVVASGGGVTERQEAERNFGAASSPAQLKGLIKTYQELMGGQLKSLNLQYENNTGRKDFDKKLTPAAKDIVKQLQGEPPAATPSANPVKIAGDADYNKLPSGALFIGPDGKQRRKP